jgi:hypothetical protein
MTTAFVSSLKPLNKGVFKFVSAASTNAPSAK